ncbi:MAG: Asp-tRNA(Asn)/Glu-tRNA(Gln) amidotransferase subunit GatB [Candidatus Zambryskibacteria bacterium]|nr:Asp-tRNA(Asn)/Glu-tRNA(Gln) amidotransferase subunit GatB [Candidatus Zambryskibacteria bacterium]
MGKDYKLTIGLEIHAELNTKTKMFCNSANHPDERRPNVNICPVCMGYPGTLPVINKEAVRSILRLGVAVGGELADFTEFDRKNYFYPDIPKGYQISQYKYPLVKGGSLNGIKITRIHLEEDTAKSTHLSPAPLLAQGEGKGGEVSLIDFNRAGVPLMELVTEPVMHTSEEAVKFAKELQLLLQYLGISNANMEKGEMRVEANISVQRSDLKNSDFQGQTLGTKVEVKNINSFRAVGKAVEFEYKRQIEILENGNEVIQETRGWDENVGATFSQRLKESAHDYRYFPEPDLPKLFINEVPDFTRTVLAESLPELPWQKRERLLKLGITAEHAEIYVTQPEWGNYFEEVIECLGDIRLIPLASNYITSDLKKPVEPEALVEVIKMVDSGELSSRGAKDILKIIEIKGGDPGQIAKEKNLIQENSKEVLKKVVEEVLNENPEASIQFLIGQAMKKTENKANPKILSELFEQVKN